MAHNGGASGKRSRDKIVVLVGIMIMGSVFTKDVKVFDMATKELIISASS